MSVTIRRSYKYVDFNVSAPNNRGYLTIDTSDWINKPWMFYELPALKFEIYTETDGELLKYKNFTREIRTYNPVYSPLGVLNVTIDIRNVPEEFILRITPIFDNDSIAARNMLIENGIENGDIWGSDQGVPTQSFDLDLEFIECEGEYVPPTPPVPPTHEETITGVPPIAFDGSTGDSLVSWTILGNGEQTGTPTPDNPVMPTFCGVRTNNLAPPLTEWVDGYLSDSGNIAQQSAVNLEKTSEYIAITAGTVYNFLHESGSFPSAETANAWKAIGWYTSSGVFISRGSQATGGSLIQTAPENAAFCRVSFRTFGNTGNAMLNPGSTPLPYEPYGYKIPLTCAGQTTHVYLGQVQTVRKIRKLVLTGEETITKYTGYGAQNCFFVNTPNVTAGEGLCDTYTNVTNLTQFINTNNSFMVSANTIRIHDGRFDEASAFKSYLAQQYAAGTPVTIWYVLATEQTGIINEPLSKIGDYADELHSTDAGVAIPTAKGQNTLTVDTELQPSEMTITYIKEGQ